VYTCLEEDESSNILHYNFKVKMLQYFLRFMSFDCCRFNVDVVMSLGSGVEMEWRCLKSGDGQRSPVHISVTSFLNVQIIRSRRTCNFECSL